jgi:hypothetical protein
VSGQAGTDSAAHAPYGSEALATIVAPIAGLFGYRGRYDEYSGPLD